MNLINTKVLMSGAEFYNNEQAINALMNAKDIVNRQKACEEHQVICDTLRSIGIEVIKVKAPENCQDGVYTANWGLVINGTVIPSILPNIRQPEEPYALQVFKNLGLKIKELPQEVSAFSGQGDCLVCDDYIFCQSPYRTDRKAHNYLRQFFPNKTVVSLQTKPKRWFKFGPPKKNKITGWVDSPSYDLDLALAVIRPGNATEPPLIAYCPSLFIRKSRRILNSLTNFQKIKVSHKEAIKDYALNLVSTGKKVVINSGTIHFKSELEKQKLEVIELNLPELKKGGGSIRCCSLSLT
jgi:N-dimethylarginine dimethylaminohydrolase